MIMDEKKIPFCSEPVRDCLHSEATKPYSWNSCRYFDVVVLLQKKETWFAFLNVYRKRLRGEKLFNFGFFPQHSIYVVVQESL